MGQYNSMWPELEHELMVGVGVTLPVFRGRRHAAVDEATSRRDRATAEIAAVTARIRAEVERARRAHQAALAVLETVRSEIVPAAESRVRAIRVGLESDRTSFIEVLRADHDLLSARLRFEMALAAVYRRRVALELALGRVGALSRGGTP
jgi:cobalt-zinc-cadmium efflux system outer membrane protein